MGARDFGGGAGAELSARFAAEVDWSKVVDPYTSERYGPDLLERLWSPDRRTADDAHDALHFACCGDGGSVRPAAFEVLTFLVEAVRDPAVKVRPHLLSTLADLARAGNGARTAAPDPKPGGWRPPAPAAWPAVWERAVDALLPGLADDAEDVRAGPVTVLAQAALRADEVVDRFRARFEDEPERAVAERLVLGVGELAARAETRRDEAVAWLRQRASDPGKGEEPDLDEDIDAWIAWTEHHGHDVRLSAIAALRRALPGRPDPADARTAADVLLRPSPADAARYRGDRALYVAHVTDADAGFGRDLPGRLAFARQLLRHETAAHHEGGLRVAANLMSRWRPAVPELLPEVAEFVDHADAVNRAFALRVLAMCGVAARPWADRVAAHLAVDDEPHEPARRHALWALGRMGDDRCVGPLAAGLLSGRATGFASWAPSVSTCAWEVSDLNYPEALGGFADRVETLLGPLLARARAASSFERGAYYAILRRWHEKGGPVVERLTRLLDEDETLVEAAQALRMLGAGPVAAAHRDRLRESLGPPRFWPDVTRVDPFVHFALTGDGEPLLALLRSPGESRFPELSAEATDRDRVRACAALGPLASGSADWLRGLFREALREKPRSPSSAPKDAVERARALWRVTGDAEEVVPALMELTADSARKAHTTPGGVQPLLLLAEVAATHPPVAGRVARRLYATARARIEGGCRSEALEILRALWKLTRDGRRTAPALVELVRICPPGGYPPTIVEPLELLAEVAAADPRCAADAAPRVRRLLDADERPVSHGQWRAVLSDEAVLAAVRTVVDAAREAGAQR
ncbi:hypothetical protein ACH4A3_23815 [Streptomyces sp. NPDC018007]|uniref:hypothetical protein n=1 Tax=Streptomyces sp. NPDC018007 TaxID=3365029 RepID=UPI00378E5853